MRRTVLSRLQSIVDRFRRNTMYARTALLFRVGFASIYFIVFLGLLPQILTLIGSKGVLPIADVQGQNILQFPTIHLLWHSDAAIILLLVLGLVASILLLLGIFPRLSLLACILIYLSYVTSGRDFFMFQWDNLLLEASFLALFLPLQGSLWKKELREPSPVLMFLFRWLVFRLYFESAVAKIVYGQGTWLNLTAMQYYYETSPLPSFGGWIVQQLFPVSFHQISVLIVFLVEGLVAFLVFAPRKARIWSFYIFAAFNLVIMFTSNYGFFNPLSIAVGLLLLDDEHIMHWKWLAKKLRNFNIRRASRAAVSVSFALAVVIVPFSILEFTPFFGVQQLPVVSSVQNAYEPYHIINSYHLFSGIVQSRSVPIIMGSNDGRLWQEYVFKHTPQNISVIPVWLPFFQDRFAFQYSFVTLGGLNSDYFLSAMQKLCSSPADVKSLLSFNPFPDKPKYLRVDLYTYKFSTPEQLMQRGVWWDREFSASTNVFDC